MQKWESWWPTLRSLKLCPMRVLGHKGHGTWNLDTLTRAGRRGFLIWRLSPGHEAKTTQTNILIIPAFRWPRFGAGGKSHIACRDGYSKRLSYKQYSSPAGGKSAAITTKIICNIGTLLSTQAFLLTSGSHFRFDRTFIYIRALRMHKESSQKLVWRKIWWGQGPVSWVGFLVVFLYFRISQFLVQISNRETQG